MDLERDRRPDSNARPPRETPVLGLAGWPGRSPTEARPFRGGGMDVIRTLSRRRRPALTPSAGSAGCGASVSTGSCWSARGSEHVLRVFADHYHRHRQHRPRAPRTRRTSGIPKPSNEAILRFLARHGTRSPSGWGGSNSRGSEDGDALTVQPPEGQGLGWQGRESTDRIKLLLRPEASHRRGGSRTGSGRSGDRDRASSG